MKNMKNQDKLEDATGVFKAVRWLGRLTKDQAELAAGIFIGNSVSITDAIYATLDMEVK